VYLVRHGATPLTERPVGRLGFLINYPWRPHGVELDNAVYRASRFGPRGASRVWLYVAAHPAIVQPCGDEATRQ
jgi:hypothetical protein